MRLPLARSRARASVSPSVRLVTCGWRANSVRQTRPGASRRSLARRPRPSARLADRSLARVVLVANGAPFLCSMTPRPPASDGRFVKSRIWSRAWATHGRPVRVRVWSAGSGGSVCARDDPLLCVRPLRREGEVGPHVRVALVPSRWLHPYRRGRSPWASRARGERGDCEIEASVALQAMWQARAKGGC
jgi:hypothetical protein